MFVIMTHVPMTNVMMYHKSKSCPLKFKEETTAHSFTGASVLNNTFHLHLVSLTSEIIDFTAPSNLAR